MGNKKSKYLIVHQSTIQCYPSLHRKNIVSQQTCQEGSPPLSRSHGLGEENSNQRGNQRSRVTLKELQSFTAETVVSVRRTTNKQYIPQSWTKVKDKNRKECFDFAKRHVEVSPNVLRKVLWSDETKIELSLSPQKHHPHSEDCEPVETIQLEGAGAVLPQDMGKNPRLIQSHLNL